MESPIIVAILVFLSIYLIWFLIRVLSDLVLVGIAMGSAILAYHIEPFYPEFLMVLTESNILNLLGLTLPKQPDSWAIFTIAILITIVAVLISIPILPFSHTYRLMFGIENPVVFRRKEAKVRSWIIEEIQRHHQQPDKNSNSAEEDLNSDKDSNSSTHDVESIESSEKTTPMTPKKWIFSLLLKNS